MAGDDADRERLWEEFHDTVTMTAKELSDWLDTDESRSVGQTPSGEQESVGHASGRHVVRILRTRKADLDDEDWAHMRTVVGYAHRHLAQRPDGDVTETPWRYSLMNWGHDPLA